MISDPEQNIELNQWDKEEELRLKADIHKARLKKHGKSKMNGEILYLGAKGGIFRITKGGNKIYI